MPMVAKKRWPLGTIALALMAIPSRHEAFTLKHNQQIFRTRSGSSLSVSGSLKEPPEQTSEFVLTVGQRQPPVGSALRMIVDEEQEFELALGKCLDTLKKDYPDILTENPDFSIYNEDLETIDPSGVKLCGLENYKKAWGFVHGIIHLFYCSERSGLTFKMVYDMARKNIRVSWNAEVVPKAIFGGTKTTLHVDGISVYEISKITGSITQHRIERLVVNDEHLETEKGLWYAMTHSDINDPERVPIPNMAVKKISNSTPPNTVLQFAPNRSRNDDNESTSLFSVSGSFDEEAFESKNASRKKFGLDPITPEEFTQLQDEVRMMERDQLQRQAAASAAKEANKPNIFQKIFGGINEGKCEQNSDCEKPEVCCDLGFTKKCCTSGMKIYNSPPSTLVPALIPVTVDIGSGVPPAGKGSGDIYDRPY